MLTRSLGFVAALALSLSLAACGDNEPSDAGTDPASSGSSTTDSTDSTDPTDPADPVTSTATEDAAPAAGEVSCTYAPDGMTSTATPPPANAPAEGTRTVALKTTIGEIDLELDAAAAPCTVNSFVSLTEQGFFDGTTCHRLTTEGIFVLQCGDPGNGPGGPGTGGPGYGIVDEFPAKAAYGPGTLAMAKTENPDSGGSQFFIVYDGAATQLPPLYTIFGKLTAGLDLVQAAAAKGTAPDGVTPAETVQIESATIG